MSPEDQIEKQLNRSELFHFVMIAGFLALTGVGIDLGSWAISLFFAPWVVLSVLSLFRPKAIMIELPDEESDTK